MAPRKNSTLQKTVKLTLRKTAMGMMNMEKSKARSTAVRKPSTWEMVRAALLNMKKRNGVSRAAIVKYLTETYQVKLSAAFNSLLRRTLNTNVQKGILLRKGNTFKFISAKIPAVCVTPKEPKSLPRIELKQLTNSTIKKRKLKDPVPAPTLPANPTPGKQVAKKVKSENTSKLPVSKTSPSKEAGKMASNAFSKPPIKAITVSPKTQRSIPPKKKIITVKATPTGRRTNVSSTASQVKSPTPVRSASTKVKRV